jgi:hypothetical protein
MVAIAKGEWPAMYIPVLSESLSQDETRLPRADEVAKLRRHEVTKLRNREVAKRGNDEVKYVVRAL